MATEDKINILVVDDLPDKLLALETVLETLGENVVTARSGHEALRRLLERDYAVILLDVKMPDMDGFETATLIRRRKKTEHTPIIFVTALSDEMHLNQGYSLGAVDYILSPVSPDVLRTKVGVFVDLYRMTEQVRRQAEERVALAREQAARAAAEEAARRLRFLAEAGAVLGRSLEATAILRGLAKLAVPFLADFAAAVLLEPDGAWRTETAGAPENAPLPAGFAERIRGVLTTGATVAADGAPACLAVPLKARGRLVGALALGGPGRRYAAEVVTLAEDLAGRAAAALENARLYHDLEEQDRRKTEFLAMLAHELRNPLAPIRNAVQILRRPITDKAGREWAQDVIDRQVGQMVRLVDDLLDVSRITRGKVKLKPEAIDVSRAAAVAVETSRPLIDARRQELTVALSPEPLWVTADAARLAQVLANLLNNAAKYTEQGGRISLTAAREGDEAVFRVRDTGVGIPEEMLPRVFELFTQVDRSLDRSEGGLGIGLTLAHRLVEMHGGTLQAFSDGPGRGSEFVVRLAALPCARPRTSPEMRSVRGRRRPAVSASSSWTTTATPPTASPCFWRTWGTPSEPPTTARPRSRRPTPSAPTPWSSTSDCRDSTATRWPGGCGRRRRPIRRRAGRAAAASHRPDRLRPRGKPPPGQGGRLRPSLRQAGGPRRVAGPVRRAPTNAPETAPLLSFPPPFDSS